MLSRIFRTLAGSASVPAIAHDELVRAHGDKRCIIVDVREPHEFASGHIRGAVNHPLSGFNPGALPEDKPVVLICQAGARSARALNQALAAGRKDVRHYAGGMNGWRARGGAVV